MSYDALGYASGSALVTHWIVEKFKEKNWVKEPLSIILASFLVNFCLAVGWALWDGSPYSVVLVRAVAQAVASALYHDLVKS